VSIQPSAPKQFTPQTFLQRLQDSGSSATSQASASIIAATNASRQRTSSFEHSILSMLDAPDAQFAGSPTKNGKAPRVLGTKAPVQGGSKAGNRIANAAQKQLGLPYGWGKEQPGVSFDCSGLVQYAYSRAGIKIPRVSNQQASYGKRVAINQLRVGDLVAWDNSSRNKGADHIAVYVGNGKIIEAPKTGLNVRTRKLGANEGAWGVQILK